MLKQQLCLLISLLLLPMALMPTSDSPSSKSASQTNTVHLNEDDEKTSNEGQCNSFPASEPSSVPVPNANKFSLGERPPAVQEAVDLAFDQLHDLGKWGIYDGSCTYGLMGLDDEKVIEDIIARAGDKKHIYIIDVGAANGCWGSCTTAFINQKFPDSDKHFSVLSLTGGAEMQENSIQTYRKVTHYRLARFKIENIATELPKHGLELNGKVDLIVSNWALRHMADPIGTLKQLYELLEPPHGTLLSTGFLFGMNSAAISSTSSRSEWKLLTYVAAKCLFRKKDTNYNADEFMFVRHDSQPFNLPIAYTGAISHIPYGNKCGSRNICIFKSDKDFRGEFAFEEDLTHQGKRVFYGTEKCRQLFVELAERGLLPRSIISKPT